MIAVEKDLVVCEKHYDSHYGEFTVCPYCRAEKAEAEIAELREEHEQWSKASLVRIVEENVRLHADLKEAEKEKDELKTELVYLRAGIDKQRKPESWIDNTDELWSNFKIIQSKLKELLEEK